jgi:hypothetical protein
MALSSPALFDGAPGERDFSLVVGGPLFQALRRAHLVDPALHLVWRRIALGVAVCWAPLFVLSLAAGQLAPAGRTLNFLADVEAQARFLVALPLLIVAEIIVHGRMRPIIAQFRARDLVAPAETAKLDAALAAALRLRNSGVAEAALAILVFVTSYLSAHHRFDQYGASWYGSSGGAELSTAGWWFAYVSLPVFQFLLARWYFRLAVWALLLFRLCRLDLRLEALHPDRCGGLGFLGGSLAAFVPLSAAHGVLIAGYVGDRVLFGGARLDSFKLTWSWRSPWWPRSSPPRSCCSSPSSRG